MQVLPQFAGPQADSLLVPAANIRAGIRLLRQIFTGYAYLDSLDRLRFTLATYHAGYGHVSDARRLAIDLGRNPNRWKGSLETTLELLMRQRYYSETRHGFYRGAETVAYVEEILDRYRTYLRLVPREEPALVATPPPSTTALEDAERPPPATTAGELLPPPD
jgi:membrane-bound lytic murein transglycosylase F